MINKVLSEIGESLYGHRWQGDIANDLGVSDRTVRAWKSGRDEVPPGVYMDLLDLLIERADEIDRLIAVLKDGLDAEKETSCEI